MQGVGDADKNDKGEEPRYLTPSDRGTLPAQSNAVGVQPETEGQERRLQPPGPRFEWQEREPSQQEGPRRVIGVGFAVGSSLCQPGEEGNQVWIGWMT